MTSLRGFDRERVVGGPLVPRARVVPGPVAGGLEQTNGHRGAAARVAVRDHLGTCGRADVLPDRLSVRQLHQHLQVDVPGSRNVPLPGVAGVAGVAHELLVRPHVEHDESLLAEAPLELVEQHLAHSVATTATSAATDGRSESRASQVSTWEYGSSETPSRSRARITHGT